LSAGFGAAHAALATSSSGLRHKAELAQCRNILRKGELSLYSSPMEERAMSTKPKFGVSWRQLVHAASGVIATMLFISPAFPRARRILVRVPRRAEIEQWRRD
jgi:hypothetical protein